MTETRPRPAARDDAQAGPDPPQSAKEASADDLLAGGSELRESALARALGSARIRAALIVALFAIVALAIYHEAEVTSWHDVRLALAAVEARQILLAVFGTAASYIALIGYDMLALRHVAAPPVPLGRVALTSFVSQAFTFNFGFGLLTGGAVRMRLYGTAGLKTDQILATSVFATFAIWLGLAAVSGAALLFAPDVAEKILSVSDAAARTLGLVLLVAVGFAWWYLAAQKPVLPGLDMQAPSAGIMGLALLVGAADVIASGFALWALLPDSAALSFSSFLVIFASAIALGMISHVPGGLGVFEGVILLAMPGAPASEMLAALLLFRFIYYLAPMLLAAGALAGAELLDRREAVKRHATRLGNSLGASIPIVSAILTFVGGFILMVSGALPAEHHRMVILRYAVPLPFVEASHFVASVIGTLLLIIAYGLARRLESAWRAAIALLLLAATFSILKGIDYEEAVVCLAIAALLYAGRRWFYRKGGALTGSIEGSEIIAIGLAIITSVWIGFIAFRNVPYDGTMWWEFAYRSDAPRFLRATIGVAVTLLIALAFRLINRPASYVHPPTPEEIASVRAIVAKSESAQANLALIGDKRFLLNAERTAFIMYGTQGSSWIAMGDPVVSQNADAAALIWQFKELADRHSGVPTLYQISSRNLPLYLDAGFSMVKLGEEAWVDLDAFSLDGPEHRKARQAMSKAERMGARFEVVPAAEVGNVLEELRSVSELWLNERGQKEKGFSLGYWSDAYMLQHDVAVVRVDGRVVAFANLWRSAGHHEASIDIMRVRPDAPNGIMDFLFTSLIQNAKTEGYRWFNLGMAPLSGLPTHRLAPFWSRAATWFSRHGDRFYNFEGLRAFKSKFKPEWRPRYLAYPGAVSLPAILIDVTTLIANAPESAHHEATLAQ